MKNVLSIKSMQESDKFTIEHYVNSKELMYAAGEACFNSVCWHGKIGIVTGKGNNGGDGFVVAKLLKENGYDVTILKTDEPVTEESIYYYEICKKLNILNYSIDENINFDNYDILVDCIYGTGFKGNIKDNIKNIIKRINNSKAYVVSVDINSGLNGDTGMCEEAIISDLTIAIQYLKPGHLLNKAKDYIKDIKVIDIGIKAIDKEYKLIEKEDIKNIFKRNNYSNKGTYGYVALIGGSDNYSGAIKLANMACVSARCGAGVVKLGVIKDIGDAVMPYLLDSTLCKLSSNNFDYIFNEEEISNLISNTKTVCVGMGLKQSVEVEKLITFLLNNYTGRLIIDADGLNTLSKMNLDILNHKKCELILSPHIKEFSRLTNKTIAEINSEPINCAKYFAKKYNLYLLLKGTCTIITNGDDVYLVNKGCPGMAVGGSGDVLSGILTSFLAFEEDILLATSASAYVNGKAGELAQQYNSSVTMLASDTIKYIKETIEKIIKE